MILYQCENGFQGNQGSSKPTMANTDLRHCQNCGCEITQTPKKKTKKFCSDQCRLNWWHGKGKSEVIETTGGSKYTRICCHCGKVFSAYGRKDAIYCSHECYIAERYSVEENNQQQPHRTDRAYNPNVEYGKWQSEPAPYTRSLPKKGLEDYRAHPFVAEINDRGLVMSPEFYKAAKPFEELGVQEILSIFEIQADALGREGVIRIKWLLKQQDSAGLAWEEIQGSINNLGLQILYNRTLKMEEMISGQLLVLRGHYKALSRREKKGICQMLAALPSDMGGRFSKTAILRSVGISRNSYYQYIGNDRYGLDVDERDARDVGDVRYAFEYKGYAKGVRIVYMLIPLLTGRSIGIARVRRIMRNYGMRCEVRKPNPNKQGAAKSMEERRKPNLLRRMFRLHRPNEVRITDVTVIEYGDGEKAYGSALMDPVTSRLIVFIVSEHNDLELAKETLRRADAHPCKNGGIFHSDQGTIYLAAEFQDEVARLGFRQSMSRRGNCWDNSPQESFFGHFKDECDYSRCRDIEELRVCIADYAYYYNYERGVWQHRQMTPVKYEEYLQGLTQDEFAEYIEREKEAYEAMRANSREKAIERNRISDAGTENYGDE